MKKTFFEVPVLNPYRSDVPKGYYDPLKKHTGIDFGFRKGDIALSPLTFTVVKTLVQPEMGKTIYCRHDATGDIYAFAHNEVFLRGAGDHVGRLDTLVITGNTGSKTTKPHSHAEGISLKPIIDPEEGGAEINKIMKRSIGGFVGYNFDVMKRWLALYAKYGIDPKTGQQKGDAVPHNPHGF